MGRRGTAVFLAVILAATMLTGCGGGTDSAESAGSSAAVASIDAAGSEEAVSSAGSAASGSDGSAGSGSSAASGSTDGGESAGSSEDTEELEVLEGMGDIQVDQGLMTVSMTFPASLMDGVTQEDLDAAVEEKGYQSATLNEDGSVTYVMSKAQHDAWMEEYRNAAKEDLAAMPGSESYPDVVSVEANDTFTEFTVITNHTELDLAESFSVLTFAMYGGMYGIFEGREVENIHVVFRNAESGELIDEWDSQDLQSAAEDAQP